MDDQKDLPPLGQLLEDAREQAGLSQNQAAKEVGISGTRWRQIVKGVGAHGVPVRGADGTVATMARLVGLKPDDLRRAGRPEAAAKLAAMIRIDEQQATEEAVSVGESAALRALAQEIAAQKKELADLRSRLAELEREKSSDKG